MIYPKDSAIHPLNEQLGQLNTGYWQDIAGGNAVGGEHPFQGRAEMFTLLNSAETEISSTLMGLGVPTAYFLIFF